MTLSGIQFVTAQPKQWQGFDHTPFKHHGIHQQTWHYGPTQQTRRFWLPDKAKKVVKPFIGIHERAWEEWMCHQGHEPWPHYFTHTPEHTWRDCFILEAEGEKCADVCASAGFAAISQPGHNRGFEPSVDRYRELRAVVSGVVYLADAKNGLETGKTLQEAAAAVGLPFHLVDMGELFPQLPEGGSIDNLHDPEAAIARIQQWVQQQPATLQVVSEPEPEAPPPSQGSLPAEEPTGRERFTFDRLVPPELGDALALLTEALPADPLTVTLTFFAHLSGLLRIGTRVASAADYDVPLNMFLALVGKTGCGKSPLLNECARLPGLDINASERADWKSKFEYWRRLPAKEREKNPPERLFSVLSGYTPAALDKQLALHEAAGKGLLLIRDELSGLFGNLAQDSKNGSGKGEAQLLELWDGTGRADILVDGHRAFDSCHFSLLGAIQPAHLKGLIKGADPTGKWARFLFLQMPQGLIIPSGEAPSEVALRRREKARAVLAAYANQLHNLPPQTYFLSDDARAKFIPWFLDHQRFSQRDSTDPLIGAMHDKSSAQFLKLAGMLHLVRYPGKQEISLDRAELGMEVVDALFAETARLHRGDGDLVDLLMDRIRDTPGPVTWDLMRKTRLDRFLKEHARSRHFQVAVSNLNNNGEGRLISQRPLTWQR